MTKDQYGEWKNHPATLFFRQFLKDRAKALGEYAHQCWLDGKPVHEVDRGRLLELIEVEDIPFEVIDNFYKEQENDDAKGIEAI